MVKVQRTKSNLAIIVAGMVLIGYLIALLSMANVGQQRLALAKQHEIELRVNQYAKTIDVFLSLSLYEMEHLARHRALDTYFANLASGMSMEYGLGASLHKLDKALLGVKHNKLINNDPFFNRISLLDLNGAVISDTQPNAPLVLDQIPLNELMLGQLQYHTIAVREGDAIGLKMFTVVYRHQMAIGVLLADINLALIKRFTSAHEHQQHASKLTLHTTQGDMVAWNSFDSELLTRDSSNLITTAPLNGAPFALEGRFSPVGKQDIFTSSGIVAAMSLMAIPVLLGFFYLLRLNTGKLLLETQVKLSEQQQQRLAKTNEALRREIGKRRESEDQLAYQANHDVLTGLPNRHYGHTALEQAIERAQASSQNVLVMYSDLDNFKRINDSQGHPLGDELLRKTSQRLRTAIRENDEVVRFSGDEFLLIFSDVTEPEMAIELANRVQSLFELPFGLEGNEFHISTSIGMAFYPKDGDDAETLIKHADAALYQSKEHGAGGYSFYEASIDQKVQRKELMERRLRLALNNNELQVYYQPILSLQKREIVGSEALVRWHDEELGWVAPDEFIALAESTGLIHTLGEQVLETACRQARAWQQYGQLRLAVNFSTAQFRHSDTLLQLINTTLAAHQFAPELLDIEVTESLLIHSENGVQTLMADLRQIGCHFSIDDFGTGYSALSYLQQFSFKKLKIDRAFVMKLEHSEADRALVSAILVMAEALNMTVVAEGIETEWQASFLGKHQCEYGQGYLFSRPVPADDFEKLLQTQQRASTQLT